MVLQRKSCCAKCIIGVNFQNANGASQALCRPWVRFERSAAANPFLCVSDQHSWPAIGPKCEMGGELPLAFCSKGQRQLPSLPQWQSCICNYMVRAILHASTSIEHVRGFLNRSHVVTVACRTWLKLVRLENALPNHHGEIRGFAQMCPVGKDASPERPPHREISFDLKRPPVLCARAIAF